MPEIEFVLRLSAILVLGVGAQWLAWRFRLPSILLLLGFGLAVGPGAEFFLGANQLKPDLVFGDLLRPFTSLAVGLILFEGGMSLRLRNITQVGTALRSLVTLGALLTWLAISGCAYGLGLLSGGLSLLLGAILVVTGPTVIGPILRQIRPQGAVGPILKWEGIVTDPIGAVLAVLVFEAILSTGGGSGLLHGVVGFCKAGLIGAALGLAGAGLLILLVRKHWVPEYLENPVALALLAACFASSNVLQEESGLIAATVMGFVVGHVLEEEAAPIAEFQENLQVLLIGILFVVLSSRLEVAHLEVALNWRAAAFVLLLIVVVRPMAVFVSTAKAPLAKAERLFLSWMAPRGIVAAAVASVFALRLGDAGQDGALALAPLTFLVIITTVGVYGLTAGPLARRLGLAVAQPQGLLLLSAQPWVRELAVTLSEAGVTVRLIDSNYRNVSAARLRGLSAVHANVRSRFVAEDLDLSGLGQFAALTANDEVNTLAAETFAGSFGRARVYQLHPAADDSHRHDPVRSARTRHVFAEALGHDRLEELFEEGYRPKATNLTAEFGFEEWQAEHGADALPLVAVSGTGLVELFSSESPPSPGAGDTLVGLVRLSAP